MKGDYLLPFQLALTELQPDIVLFSKSTKRAILLELTCPCKENMESWHSQKLIKYTPLAKVIEDNGWAVDLFAIEVGARGYSSTSLSICFKRLGFNNKTVQKTTKSLSFISMKASFYIWLARSSSGWSSNTSLITIEDANFAVAGSKNTNPSRDSRNSNIPSVSSQPTRNLRKCNQDTKHPGFSNKGNTCYANSILQVLSAIPSFWCQSASESGFLSPLTRAMTLNMSLLKRRTTPVDPSNFLWALCRKLSTIKQVPFQFNTQQDVLEILQVVLDELKGHSTIASNILVTSVRTSTTCDTCGCCKIEEVKLDIIPLTLAKSISLSLDRLLSS